ncbi:hypothetical protein GCM10009678_76100 [Actinomadura kijaniata]|uniref:Uncharacterized protein n=1 Tax=Actinomadura namibiensis TaxID=182080 RepID=A0A7W3QSP3_ACTNM|nr:hypothetical protein [Actinomadura namibiensis]MBA8957598.1 hypothetical protein [Actinomadura namibiensis]
MSESESVRGKRERITEIEESVAVLRRELGERTDDPMDFGDAGQDLEAREQQLSMIEALEGERRRLLDELGESDRS